VRQEDRPSTSWGVTKGRDDVLVSVLDSGSCAARIAWPISRPPRTSTSVKRNRRAVRSGDCNGDGIFDIRDFAGVADRNGNGVADPEDLILDPRSATVSTTITTVTSTTSPGGTSSTATTIRSTRWSTARHRRGRGLQRARTAPAMSGMPALPVAPDPRFRLVRRRGGRFAAGVMFALDSGADVVQEALGALTNPVQAQQAIDVAYERVSSWSRRWRTKPRSTRTCPRRSSTRWR
jgi:hypothetical protein